MSFEQDAARRYRDHAAELREIARSYVYLPTQDLLLNVAADFERMAQNLEAIDQANRAVRRH